MARVFVSHAGADLALACEVHGWLVETGHEVFLDRDPCDGLAVGERWEQRLYERLRWADAVICVVTSAYLASPWCTAEVGAAHARGSRVLHTLRPLRREALRAVIEKPAQLAGIEVDDGLVERLVDDTDTGEALPLLAFTLAQLADSITHGGRLSHARYNQLGGVHGALTHQADAALAEAISAGGRSREQVIAGLLRLVTVDEQAARHAGGSTAPSYPSTPSPN